MVRTFCLLYSSFSRISRERESSSELKTTPKHSNHHHNYLNCQAIIYHSFIMTQLTHNVQRLINLKHLAPISPVALFLCWLIHFQIYLHSLMPSLPGWPIHSKPYNSEIIAVYNPFISIESYKCKLIVWL